MWVGVYEIWKIKEVWEEKKRKARAFGCSHNQKHNYVDQNKVENAFKLGRLKFLVMVIHLKGVWAH